MVLLVFVTKCISDFIWVECVTITSLNTALLFYGFSSRPLPGMYRQKLLQHNVSETILIVLHRVLYWSGGPLGVILRSCKP